MMSGHPRRLYFAHPVTSYGTQQEADAIADISRNLARPPLWEIVNPNEPSHDEGYARLGMPYFIELCDGCDECVFMAFPSGKVGAGVAAEVQSFLDRGRPVSEYRGSSVSSAVESIEGRVLSVEMTRWQIAEIRGEV